MSTTRTPGLPKDRPVAAMTVQDFPSFSIPRRSHPLVNHIVGYIHLCLMHVSEWYARWTGVPLNSWGGLYPLPFGLFLKMTTGTREEEFINMKVARAIGLPVPRAFSYGDHGEESPGSILMELVRGEQLTDVYKTLTPDELENIKAELARCLRLMRSFRSPFGPQICSLSGHSIRSPRVPMHIIGPCQDEYTFQFQLTAASTSSSLRRLPFDTLQEAKSYAMSTSSIPHRIVLTHGDLWHHNIMIRNGRLAAIIDWEASGWYPEYWEFTSAQRMKSPNTWWSQLMRELSDNVYEEEMKRESVLWALTSLSFI